MAKDVINVAGEDRVVEETTAKAYRGVNWMIMSLVGFIVIALVVAAIFLMRGAADGELKSPAGVANATNSTR